MQNRSYRLVKISLSLILPVFLGIIFSIVIYLFIGGLRGQDTHVYCQAANASLNGRNPFLTRELGTSLPWIYQPVYLRLVVLLCSPTINLEANYIFLYSILIAISTLLWSTKEDWGYAIFLSFSIFVGFSWILYSGNLTAIEFFLVSCGFGLLKQKKWSGSAIFFGLSASLKLIPLIFLSLFAFIPSDGIKRFRYILLGIMAFVFPLLLSSHFYPGLTLFFFKQTLGAIPDQQNALQEVGGIYNPSLSLFLVSLFNMNFLKSNLLISIILVIFGFCFILLLYYWTKPLQVNQTFYKFFTYAYIVITLFLPRNKPYSFVLLAPAVYLLLEDEKGLIKQVAQISIIGVPAVFVILDIFLKNQGVPLTAWYFLVMDYSQVLALLIFAIIWYIYYYLGKRFENYRPDPGRGN